MNFTFLKMPLDSTLLAAGADFTPAHRLFPVLDDETSIDNWGVTIHSFHGWWQATHLTGHGLSGP